MARSSRRNSRAAAIAAIIALGAVVVSAHRKDEYLQAARLGIEPGVAQVQLDLTPGIAIGEASIGEIDRDRDGVFSDVEQRAYASAVVTGLQMDLDGRAVPLQLGHAAFPSPDDIRRGEGTIALRATADLPSSTGGAHRLTFRNNHHPAASVYLANALVPDSPLVSVTGQLRDTEQRVLSVDYLLKPSLKVMTLSVGWMAGGLAMAVAASLLLFRPLRTAP